jgi:hypothetical protein
MEWTNRQLQEFHAALLDAFPNRGALEQMVRWGLDKNLAEIVGGSNLAQTVFELLTWASAHGQLESLLQAARDANSGNARLRKLAAAIQDPPDAIQPHTKEVANAMVLTRALRRQLLAALNALSVLDTPAGRDPLLRDLPAALVSALPRNPAKALDLDAIVDGCARWQPASGTDHPLQILIENARDLAAGQQQAADLQAILDALKG